MSSPVPVAVDDAIRTSAHLRSAAHYVDNALGRDSLLGSEYDELKRVLERLYEIDERIGAALMAGEL